VGKFNRKLSQLEATYQIAGPVLKVEDPAVISSFIKTVFENSEEYGLDQLNKDWFNRFSSIDSKRATNFVHNLLQESNQLISKKSILEGIELFNTENHDGET
jgi:hypothetical protein